MSDRAEDGETLWSVWRQDDTGHRFEVARGLSASDAARALARFEASEHKQMYWIAATGRQAEDR
jgi:hypothetical protein